MKLHLPGGLSLPPNVPPKLREMIAQAVSEGVEVVEADQVHPWVDVCCKEFDGPGEFLDAVMVVDRGYAEAHREERAFVRPYCPGEYSLHPEADSPWESDPQRRIALMKDLGAQGQAILVTVIGDPEDGFRSRAPIQLPPPEPPLDGKVLPIDGHRRWGAMGRGLTW